MSAATVLLYLFSVYIVAGLCTAAAFVTFGVTRALDVPASMTSGARILIFPGAVALWPYVLRRWLKSGRQP